MKLEEWPPEEFWQLEDMPEPDPFADTTSEDPEIRKALDAAGYYYVPATEAELRSCFLDYAAAGYWSNLDFDDAVEEIQSRDISKQMMIEALRRG